MRLRLLKQWCRSVSLLIGTFAATSSFAKDYFPALFSYQLSEADLEPFQKKLELILERLIAAGERLKNESPDPEIRNKPAFDVDFEIRYEHAREERANVAWKYKVKPNQSGRKVIPITIFRGLLEFVQTEDELAGIIAHEMIHPNHGVDDQGNKLPILSNWARLRRNEFEADLLGARLARAAGYDLRDVQKGMLRILKIEDKQLALKTIGQLGSTLFQAAVPTHSISSLEERYNTFNGFLFAENRVAKLDRSPDNPYDGWLERYKGALIAPWSKDEPNEGMQTFLERLFFKTDLKHRPIHQRIAFLRQLFFESPGYQTLFYHGLMVDPHVNPNPIFNFLTYRPNNASGSFIYQSTSMPLFHLNTNAPLPNSAPTYEHVTDVDLEYMLKFVQDLISREPSIDHVTRVEVARLISSIGHHSDFPLNYFSSIKKIRDFFAFRLSIKPQKQWRFSPERMLHLENTISPYPEINSFDDYQRIMTELTPEQRSEALIFLSKKILKKFEVSLSDRRQVIGHSDLSKIFEDIQKIDPQLWTERLAEEYIKILPYLHASTFESKLSYQILKNLNGYTYSPRVFHLSAWTSSSGFAKLKVGVSKYLQNIPSDVQIPLALRIYVSHQVLEENKPSYLSTVKTLNEYITAYLEYRKLVFGSEISTAKQNKSDKMVFEFMKNRSKWKVDSESLLKVFTNLNFSWIRDSSKEKRNVIAVDVFGDDFPVDLESRSIGTENIKEGLKKFGYVDPDFEKSLDQISSFSRTSSVEFDVEFSTKLQKEFLLRFYRDNLNPNQKDLADVHYALSAIGNTADMDSFAERLYIDDKYSDESSIKRVLDEARVWNFLTRKKIFDRWYEIEGSRLMAALPDNKARIEKFTLLLSRWFPEPTGERADIVEAFSQEIESTFNEAKILDFLKTPHDANNESLALRLFSALRTEMTSDPRYPHRGLDFVRFLIGASGFPSMPAHKIEDSDRDGFYKVKDAVTGKTLKTKGFAHDVIGPIRLKKLFDSLSPTLKAACLSYYIATPRTGALDNPKYLEEIKKIILRRVERQYYADARIILDALFYAEKKVDPHGYPFTVSYLLAQSGGGRVYRTGQVFREALTAKGAAGISFGQKLYQRRMLPDHMLEDLADLQDNADPYSRFEAYEELITKLQIKDPDLELKLEKALGSASSKVVFSIKLLHEMEQTSEAVKILRTNFRRRIVVDEEVFKEFVHYLDVHGKGRFSHVGPLIGDTFDSLRRQSDMGAEPRNREIMTRLYQTDMANGAPSTVDRFGFEWHVAESRDGSLDHLREELVEGVTFKALSEADRSMYAPAIYEKEESILLHNLDSADPNEKIYFERDRHFGNYIVNGKRINLIDYPLLTSISISERAAIFELLGNSEVSRSLGTFVPQVLRSNLLQAMMTVAENANQEQVDRILNMWLKARDSKRELGMQVLDLFSEMQKNGIVVKESVHAYLVSLGHLEGFAHYLPRRDSGSLRIRSVIASIVKEKLEPTLRKMSRGDKCLLFLGRLKSGIVN